jgi:LAS superfamily LD-carboxypeptidase LdcB
MNIDILLGKTTEHLVPLAGTKYFVHRLMLHDFLKLQRDAKEAGFDLQIASAFRDYERQALIWNKKAKGERGLRDDSGRDLTFATLSPLQIMYAILRWSAIPGTSRHHWGTDIDVFDGSTQTQEDVQLVPEECIGHGPASGLHQWLDERIHQDAAYSFYRPYKTDKGGIAPERWHLSYFPIARRITDIYTYSIFKKNIEESTLTLKEELLDHSFDIFQRYFINTDLP